MTVLSRTSATTIFNTSKRQRCPAPLSRNSFAVSGSAVHYVSQPVIYSQEPTANGMIQQSTAYIELTGDLAGYILFDPTSVFDFAAGTLPAEGAGTSATSP